MRPLEIALLISILALCVITLSLRRSALPRVLYAIPALIAVLHAIPFVEGARWQMVPAYLCALLLLVLAGQPAAYFRRGLVKIALVGVILSAVTALILPVPTYSNPGGPYRVGTTVLHLVDRDRSEIYGDDPGAPREITIQIWYPMESVDGTLSWRFAPVILEAQKFTGAFSREFGLPAFTMDHVGLLSSHSYLRDGGLQGLLIADDQGHYPVVVGSHGWRGFRALHTPQFEELASHGYIAVGIDHTYGAMMTIVRDGRAVAYDPAALPDGVSDADYDAASVVLEDVYEADIKFVLDEVERLNREGDFAGKLDLARTGLFGHSTGGGAMVQTCQTDARCKAGFAMDAWVEPIPAEQRVQGVPQPFLFIRSEPWTRNDNDTVLDQMYDDTPGEKYRLAIKGTLHRDFTLQGTLSPLLQLIGFTGKLEPVRTLDIVNAYMLAFFDHTLKGVPAPLMDGASTSYPEVIFE